MTPQAATVNAPILDWESRRTIGLTAALWALRAALLALALVVFVRPLPSSTPTLVLSAAFAGACLSLAVALLPQTRPGFLQAAETMMLLGISLHVAGHVFALYATVPEYDKLLHLLYTPTIPFTLYAVARGSLRAWTMPKLSPVELGIAVFLVTATLGVLWEAYEFAFDALFRTTMQHGNTDTMGDLIANLAGGLLAGVATAFSRARPRTQAMP